MGTCRYPQGPEVWDPAELKLEAIVNSLMVSAGNQTHFCLKFPLSHLSSP